MTAIGTGRFRSRASPNGPNTSLRSLIRPQSREARPPQAHLNAQSSEDPCFLPLLPFPPIPPSFLLIHLHSPPFTPPFTSIHPPLTSISPLPMASTDAPTTLTMDDPSTLATVATIILQVFMVVGPVTGYVDQYLVVSRTKSSQGFSIETCGVLIIANIVRIFFWLGKRFDNTLLYQSILMIIVQLILLELVIRHRPGSVSLPIHRVALPDAGLDSDSDSPSASLSSVSIDPPRSSFWHWPRYIDYAAFLVAFTSVIIGLYLLFGGSPLFIELLGFASLGVESTLPIPQCVSNFRRKSVAGFSTVLLGLWTVGDGLKFAYFLWTNSPLQFVLCGAFQLSVDFVILGQFVIWSPDFRRRLGLSVEHIEAQYEPIREENI